MKNKRSKIKPHFFLHHTFLYLASTILLLPIFSQNLELAYSETKVNIEPNQAAKIFIQQESISPAEVIINIVGKNVKPLRVFDLLTPNRVIMDFDELILIDNKLVNKRINNRLISKIRKKNIRSRKRLEISTKGKDPIGFEWIAKKDLLILKLYSKDHPRAKAAYEESQKTALSLSKDLEAAEKKYYFGSEKPEQLEAPIINSEIKEKTSEPENEKILSKLEDLFAAKEVTELQVEDPIIEVDTAIPDEEQIVIDIADIAPDFDSLIQIEEEAEIENMTAEQVELPTAIEAETLNAEEIEMVKEMPEEELIAGDIPEELESENISTSSLIVTTDNTEESTAMPVEEPIIVTEEKTETLQLEAEEVETAQEDQEILASPKIEPIPSSKLAEAALESSAIEMKENNILLGLGFQNLEVEDSRTSNLKFELENNSEFSLVKSGKQEYQLVLNETIASEHLYNVFFPPKDFPAITYVQPSQDQETLTIKIGIEEAKKLAAIPIEGGILIQNAN